MDLAAILKAFVAVFPAELPDKTMIATVVLVAHHRRPLAVWAGAALAFTLHVTVAVTAGQFLGRLPETWVTVATTLLFAVGAIVMWRGADEPEDADDADATAAPGTPLAALAGSFGVIALAEWGDLTQLATAGIAASTEAPLSVAIGALAALWLVAALAARFGQAALSRIPASRLRRGAAVVFGALAVLTITGVA